MLCRRETVIVFHKTATNDSNTVTIQTTCHEDVRPTITYPRGATINAIQSDGPLPNFSDIFGASNPPAIPPIAPAVPKIENTNTEVPKTSWANKIKVTPTNVPTPFMQPKIIASGRSNV